jgi:hypothetical protein
MDADAQDAGWAVTDHSVSRGTVDAGDIPAGRRILAHCHFGSHRRRSIDVERVRWPPSRGPWVALCRSSQNSDYCTPTARAVFALQHRRHPVHGDAAQHWTSQPCSIATVMVLRRTGRGKDGGQLKLPPRHRFTRAQAQAEIGCAGHSPHSRRVRSEAAHPRGLSARSGLHSPRPLELGPTRNQVRA